MIEKHELNRTRWNEITPVHVRSDFYNVEGFLNGAPALDHIEREGVGDVRGKSVLHLQCHFGMSTLEFARLGADAVGVDFSDVAIAQANELAEKLWLTDHARFLCCDVLELDKRLDERFDVVFTSYGVLTWLSDLPKWGQIVARYLKPGGKFFVVEVHPASLIYHETRVPLEIAYDYFNDPAGIVLPPGPDYADPSHVQGSGERYWAWPLSDIFHALTEAGLTVTDLREYPFTCFKQFPHMEKQADGFWHLPAGVPKISLLFSMTAVIR